MFDLNGNSVFYVATAAILFLALLVLSFCQPSSAKGLGNHPPPEAHWYDAECCSNRDCGPVLHSKTDQTGLLITIFNGTAYVEENTKRLESRDHRMHACIVKDQPTVKCIYMPPAARRGSSQ